MHFEDNRALPRTCFVALQPAFDLANDRRTVDEQARTATDRTGVRQRVRNRLANALTRDLHEAEFRERKDRTLRAVAAKLFLHFVIDLLAVALIGHVDEVDHDNTAD